MLVQETGAKAQRGCLERWQEIDQWWGHQQLSWGLQPLACPQGQVDQQLLGLGQAGRVHQESHWHRAW